MWKKEAIPMPGTSLMQHRVGAGLIWTAAVLLVGIVVLAAGYYTGSRVAFYLGAVVTLAGVLSGIRLVVLRDEP
jgi:hypothetical protein